MTSIELGLHEVIDTNPLQPPLASTHHGAMLNIIIGLNAEMLISAAAIEVLYCTPNATAITTALGHSVAGY